MKDCSSSGWHCLQIRQEGHGSRLARYLRRTQQDKPQHFYFTKAFMLNAQFLEESRHSNSKVLEKILKLTDNFSSVFKMLVGVGM